MAGALLAGAGLSVQAVINAALAREIGHPLTVALISFAVGILVLIVAAGLSRAPWPDPTAVRDMPWWLWIGGCFGAYYITLSILAAPKLGAATLIAMVIAGQMVAALVIDHFGAAGVPEHGITPWRAVGAALITVGVVLVRIY
jgi:transporter family-2 protein